MSRLDVTLDRLLRPGLGVLVLDEYADHEAERRGLPVSALATLADQVLRSPLVGRRLSGVLVSERHLTSMPPPIAPTQAAPPFVGLRIDVGTSESSASEAVEAARRNGADYVELRSNRRP